MNIHAIGSGTPDAKPERCGSAFALELGEELVLVDCGPGTTCKMGRMGLDHRAVRHLFLTHHHFDHNADLPCFALVWWDQSGTPAYPLTIHGPAPTEAFVDALLGEHGAFSDDWHARVALPASQILHKERGGLLPRPAPLDVIRATDIEAGAVVETDSWKATALWVHHAEPWLQSLIYRFDTDEGSVLFTGDGGVCDALTEACLDVDTLVICCAYTGDIHPDIGHVVTGVPAVAAIAEQTRAARIILTHQSDGLARRDVRERAVAEIGKSYSGEVIFADELASYSI